MIGRQTAVENVFTPILQPNVVLNWKCARTSCIRVFNGPLHEEECIHPHTIAMTQQYLFLIGQRTLKSSKIRKLIFSRTNKKCTTRCQVNIVGKSSHSSAGRVENAEVRAPDGKYIKQTLGYACLFALYIFGRTNVIERCVHFSSN